MVDCANQHKCVQQIGSMYINEERSAINKIGASFFSITLVLPNSYSAVFEMVLPAKVRFASYALSDMHGTLQCANFSCDHCFSISGIRGGCSPVPGYKLRQVAI